MVPDPRGEVHPVSPGEGRIIGTHARSLQTLCCGAAFDYNAYPYFNADSKVYPFPLINHRFVSTVVLGPESLL